MLKLYKIASYIIYPLLPILLLIRQLKGKEDKVRKSEKLGIIKTPRPIGKLLWINCASVGEANASLALIDSILEQDKEINILMTTGTLSSANLMVKKLPTRVIHQFNPLDSPIIVKKFLNHWNPDSVIWTESELWPNTLAEIKKRNIPASLINARMSPVSFKYWSKYPNMIQKMLSTFSICLTQTKKDGALLRKLDTKNVLDLGNLKFTVGAPAVDESKLEKLRKSVQDRNIMCYSSTHKGEEDIAIRIHQNIKGDISNLLTIIIPRHPDRRDEIKNILEKANLNFAFRSEDKLPNAETDVYVADTFGEMGTFYSVCPLVFMGGSFSPYHDGGHNPIEPLKFSCAILSGNKISVYGEIFEQLKGPCKVLQTEKELENNILDLMKNKEKIALMAKQGREMVGKDNTILQDILAELKKVKVI